MRLFVGVWPSDDVRAALERLDRSSPEVRWVAPANWHVTLRFLGDVDDSDLTSLRRALAGVASQYSPRAASLGPLTEILGRRVLVAPVAGVDDLGKTVIQATAGFGRPPDTRPFTGHLTLARAKNRAAIPTGLAGQPVFASWIVNEIALIRSTVSRSGSTYETLAGFGLREES